MASMRYLICRADDRAHPVSEVSVAPGDDASARVKALMLAEGRAKDSAHAFEVIDSGGEVIYTAPPGRRK